VFVAGGIGIAPIRSMLLTMRDREDARDAILFYAAHDASRLVFAGELDALAAVLRLRVVYVFEAPPPGWSGERGHITRELLRRHLPAQFRRYHYYVCGPVGMMDAVEASLTSLGVPSAAVETERFHMV
jgi:ferredoxin-NADP reductase